MTAEKRESDRSPIERAASFGIPEAKEMCKSATLKNYSDKGFMIVSDKNIKKGTKLELSIAENEDKHISVAVEVVWSKQDEESEKYNIGVKLVDESNPASQSILEFLDRTSPR